MITLYYVFREVYFDENTNCFAINESYYKQLETVIVSILENSQSNFEFIVLSKGLPEFCKDAIGKTISLYAIAVRQDL